MKKVIFSIGLCLCVGFSAMAQVDETADPALVNKRGVSILPKAGDFALGISTDPFFNYMGNFFGKSNTNTYKPTFTNDFGIHGKYFLQDDRAIRVGLNLGLGSSKSIGTVADNTTTDKFGEDELKRNATNVDLFVGYEIRRGRGRVQGFYGGGVNVGFGSDKETYSYYNSFSSTTPAPTTTTNFSTGASSPQSSRTTEWKSGAEFSVGLGGFVGVEYFFAPQMSLGGEFGLGLGFSNRGKGKTITEYWDAVDSRVRTNETEARNGNTGNFTFGTDSSASIFLTFYF